ncbi:MAG: class I SAM-dependent RNA methyltransferase [Candidatus Dormibacteria bacterium]
MSGPAARLPRQRVELKVTEMAHGGPALGRTDEGQVVFVDDALPGEVVVAEVAGRRSNYLRARAMEVSNPNPGRVIPPCPYVPECGGCQWQHAGYETQLELKRGIFAAAMRRAGAVVPEADMVPCDHPLRYRVRGELHVFEADGAWRLGFVRRRSWEPIAVSDCLIHHPHITEAMPGIERALGRTGGGAMKSLHLTTTPARRELLWQARGGEAPAGFGLALEQELPAWVVHQDSLTLEYDAGRIDGREGPPLIFRVDSETFIQVNHHHSHRLYGRALEYLGDQPGSLVEGYAGFGAMSILALTRPDPRTRPTRGVLVEEARSSSIMGRLHLRLHEVEEMAVYLHGSVEDRFAELQPDDVDTLLVDPPRAGCSVELIHEVGRLKPSRMVYVSCDPATLGRDLARLREVGYSVGAQSIVDMFPQTYHVESVTLLAPAQA